MGMVSLIEFFWSNEWGGKILFANGSNDSRGVMILFKPSLCFTVLKTECDNIGRFIIADIKVENQVFTIINV